MANAMDTVTKVVVATAALILIASPTGTAYYVGEDLQREGNVPELHTSSVETDNGFGGKARNIKSGAMGCSMNNGSEAGLACFGARMLEKALDTLLSKKRYRFSDDVEIVEVGRGGRSMATEEDNVDGDPPSSPFDGVIRRIKAFLGNHEIRLRLPRLSSLPVDFRSVFDNETFPEAFDLLNRAGFTRQLMASVGTARGKNKGAGALMAAMLMSAATIGAVGLKGIGLLALKALALSSAAFVLSLIAALKKLVSKDDEGGGGHYVSYVPVHHSSGHHRRSLDLSASDVAYRAHSPN